MMRELWQFVLYCASGVIATGTHYAVMASLIRWGAVPEVVATCVGFIAGAIVKYPLNYRMVFSSHERHDRAVPRYLASLVISFALNALVFAALLRVLNAYYMVAQVLTTGLVLLVNFALARYWIFVPTRGGEKPGAGAEVEERRA
jgi:putative flippase GtrA